MVERILRKVRSIFLHRRVRDEEQLLKIPPFNLIKSSSIDANAQLLRPQYEKYVTEVSSANMAASLELSALVLSLCQVSGYKKIADLGSGFTSYVLRLYASTTPGVEIFSIDDDPLWLEKTRSFLKSYGVDDSNLMTLDQFIEAKTGNFDCILHDLNFVEVRINYVDALLDRISQHGILILDDMHKPDYRIEVLRKLAGRPYNIYSLKRITGDALGRYSMAVTKS
jgi:predicted O-methyltransferase YrrM